MRNAWPKALNGILKHTQKARRSVFNQVFDIKSKLLSVFLLAEAYASLVGCWTNFKINTLLVGWSYVASIKPIALEMFSSQLKEEEFDRGKKKRYLLGTMLS